MNLLSCVRAPVSAVARVAAVLLIASGTAAVNGQVQAPSVYFSGPSTARSGSAALFQGGNFKPDTGYTVTVISPGGQEAAYGTVSNSSGELRFEFSPSAKGEYRMRVTGPRRAVMAEAVLIAAEPAAGS